MASDDRMHALQEKKSQLAQILSEFQNTKISPEEINPGLEAIQSSTTREKTSIASLLRRPEIGIDQIKKLHPTFSNLIQSVPIDVAEQAEILLKYQPYIDREQKMAEKIEGLDNYQIYHDFDYDRVKALSSEAREKLKKMRPATIGQMSRISGVTPADVSIMTVYLGK